MLNDAATFSSFSTNDLDRAKQFYGETLGLKVTDEHNMGIAEVHLAHGAQAMVYPKPDHTPATFTVLNFMVEDVEKTVDELTAKGVTFEHYDNEYMKTDAKGIADGGGKGPKMAWFKDPAGNILSVLQASN